MPSASKPLSSRGSGLPVPSMAFSVAAVFSGLSMPESGLPSRSFSVMTSVTRKVPLSSSITR